MGFISLALARAEAEQRGATAAEIEAEEAFQRKAGKDSRVMTIRALNFHPWSNSKEEWVRLVAAMLAHKENA